MKPVQLTIRHSKMKLTEAYSRKQLKNIRRLYKKAFPRAEKKPFFLMLKKRKEHSMELLAIEEEDGGFLGLAIMVLYRDMALLDYFAVLPKLRGSGVGSEAFQMLKERYGDRKFFLEIESTADAAENAGERKRRKAFYLRNGMTELPFCVNLFGVDMEILGASCFLAYKDYYELYRKVFGRAAAKWVKLR